MIMSTTPNPDEFYKKLKAQLEDTTTFPSNYMYKFIVPSIENKAADVIDKFDNLGASINTKKSKTGKYTSVSVEVIMNSADQIIEKYKEVSLIEGVISL